MQKKERKDAQEEYVDKKTKAEEMKSKLKDKKTDWSEYLDQPVAGGEEAEEGAETNGKKVAKKGKLESEKYQVKMKSDDANEDELLGKRGSGDFDGAENSDDYEDGDSDFGAEDGEELENFDEFIDKFNME